MLRLTISKSEACSPPSHSSRASESIHRTTQGWVARPGFPVEFTRFRLTQPRYSQGISPWSRELDRHSTGHMNRSSMQKRGRDIMTPINLKTNYLLIPTPALHVHTICNRFRTFILSLGFHMQFSKLQNSPKLINRPLHLIYCCLCSRLLFAATASRGKA